MKEEEPRGLPREWLPEPVAPADGGDAPEWELRLERLMRAAEPRLADLARATWWANLGAAWKPALAAAAVAAGVLVLGLRAGPAPGTPSPPAAETFALTTVTDGGSAASLWRGLGAEADPVLAQVVLQEEAR